jgi:hypothetical protein
MAQFNLSGTVTVSIYTEVEAETLEEAIEIAKGRNIEKSRWGDKHQETQVWVTDDYDGEPMNIEEV